MKDTAEARLLGLGLKLPEAAQPLANYVTALQAGDLLFISGQISRHADGSVYAGKLGADLSLQQGQEAARSSALSILSQAKARLGSLERIVQVTRLSGYVACAPQFREHPQVLNGASDLMVAVLGEKGKHTRSAIGVASLPAGAAVEIDAVLQVKN